MRSRRILQVREEAGDQAPDTAEEEPGGGLQVREEAGDPFPRYRSSRRQEQEL
jgi:hypothetical protein